jgi:hypothetical protein
VEDKPDGRSEPWGQVEPSCYRAEAKGSGGFNEGTFAMRTWIFCGAQACVLPGGLGSRVGTMAQWNKPREWGGSLVVGFAGWHTGWATSGPDMEG